MIWIIISILLYIIPLSFVIYHTKWVKNTSTFNLADRKISSLLLFASISATFVGPGYSIGFIGKGYNFGLWFWLFGLAYSLQNILVGIFISPKLREGTSNISTLGGFFEWKLNNLTIKKVVGFLSVGICTGLSAVMLQAGGTLFNSFFNLPPSIGIIIIASITLIYTLTGGLKGSIYTDVFQFLFFTIIISVSVLYLLKHSSYSTSNLYGSLIQLNLNGKNEFSVFKIVGLFLLFFLGETLIPPYVNRAFSSSNKRAAKLGFIYSGLFAFFWFLFMVSIGIFAHSVLKGAQLEPDSEFFTLIGNVHPIIKYSLGVTIFGIVMSSLDSLVNSGAISFGQDFFTKSDEKNQLLLSRWSIVFIIIVASISALYINSIITGLLIFYSIWAPAILPSLIYIIYNKKPKYLTVLISVILGSLISIVSSILPFSYDKEIIPFTFGLISSIFSIFLTHNILKK